MITGEHELYLSRLILNPRSRDVRRDLGNCHELHRTILRALPQVEDNGAKARERFGVLHRLEIDQRQQKLTLLVQSFLKPAWSRLPSDYLLLTDEENPACKPVHDTYSRLGAGQCLPFVYVPTQHGVCQEKTRKKRSGRASESKFVMRDSRLPGCSVRGKRLDSNSPPYALTI